MEIVLAIVVVSAVIFFGALLSLGNERQRKAIDELREQVVLWALQDLRIKREHLAREVRVNDPLAWLNRLAGRACGVPVNLQVVKVYFEPQAILCIAEDNASLIFSPLSPVDVRMLKKTRRGRLDQTSEAHPLLALPKAARSAEFTPLNGDLLFDLELPLAWKGLTGQAAETLNRLWMYVVE